MKLSDHLAGAFLVNYGQINRIIAIEDTNDLDGTTITHILCRNDDGEISAIAFEALREDDVRVFSTREAAEASVELGNDEPEAEAA